MRQGSVLLQASEERRGEARDQRERLPRIQLEELQLGGGAESSGFRVLGKIEHASLGTSTIKRRTMQADLNQNAGSWYLFQNVFNGCHVQLYVVYDLYGVDGARWCGFVVRWVSQKNAASTDYDSWKPEIWGLAVHGGVRHHRLRFFLQASG